MHNVEFYLGNENDCSSERDSTEFLYRIITNVKIDPAFNVENVCLFFKGKDAVKERRKRTERSQVVVLSKAGEHLASGRTV